MENDLISRSAAISIIEDKQRDLCPAGCFGRHYVYGTDREKFDAWDEIIDQLDAIPTEDAAPVVHSRFVNMGGFPACERCGASPGVHEPKPDNPRGFPPYCYACGAKMDKEES